MPRGLYTLSEMVELILQDIGVWDLPIIETVSKEAIIRRLEMSSLKEFSTRCPYIKNWDMSDAHLLHKNKAGDAQYNSLRGIEYVVPESEYAGHTLLGISYIESKGATGFNDPYVPASYTFAPDVMMETIADIQMAASLAKNMSKALTWEFRKPNIVTLYNGWATGTYVVKLMMTHDTSLSTISDTAMTHFRKLATYDIEWFLYNRFKRLQNLDTGVGNFELRIDDWQGAEDKFREYLDQIDEDQSLDLDYMQMF